MELLEAGATVVFESLEELLDNLDQTPLRSRSRVA
jgi:hypothetical protein